MIPWPWLILAFYSGIAFGIFTIALLQANGGPTPEEDAEQAAYLAAQMHGDGSL